MSKKQILGTFIAGGIGAVIFKLVLEKPVNKITKEITR